MSSGRAILFATISFLPGIQKSMHIDNSWNISLPTSVSLSNLSCGIEERALNSVTTHGCLARQMRSIPMSLIGITCFVRQIEHT
jgi:hypothetical protein